MLPVEWAGRVNGGWLIVRLEKGSKWKEQRSAFPFGRHISFRLLCGRQRKHEYFLEKLLPFSAFSSKLKHGPTVITQKSKGVV